MSSSKLVESFYQVVFGTVYKNKNNYKNEQKVGMRLKKYRNKRSRDTYMYFIMS